MKLLGKEILTIEDFDSRYTYDKSIVSKVLCAESQRGQLETFGEDAKKAWEVYERESMKVWTAINGVLGLTIVSGITSVDAVYHIVTLEEAQTSDEEYVLENDLEEVEEKCLTWAIDKMKLFKNTFNSINDTKQHRDDNGNLGFIIRSDMFNLKKNEILKWCHTHTCDYEEFGDSTFIKLKFQTLDYL